MTVLAASPECGRGATPAPRPPLQQDRPPQRAPPMSCGSSSRDARSATDCTDMQVAVAAALSPTLSIMKKGKIMEKDVCVV